jgi:hypothetical protein
MVNEQIIDKFNKLPKELQNEALDFIDFLLSKHNQSLEDIDNKSRNGFGILKGKISITDDFDEPLEDFKNYMD